MNASRRVSLLFCVFFLVLISAPLAHAQCVSLTTLGAATTQNFDGLSNTPALGVAWTDNTTLAAWYSTRTTYNIGTGSQNNGGLWSFGVAGTNPVTDRALGGIGSGGTGTYYWAGCFTNNTGAALTSVDIAYIGEQWRDGNPAPAAAHTIAFQYQVAASGVITDADTPTTGWTAVAALDFTGPDTGGAAGALDGNAAINRTARAATITVAVPVGNEFWVRWRDIDNASNDHGLAVDDFSITPQGVVANQPIVPTCATPVTTTAGTATTQGVSATDSDGTVTGAAITSITPSDPGTITLTGFTPAGAVGGTANATLNVSAATPANTYSVTIQWTNNDGVPQTANCVVSVVVNAPPVIVFIHDVQGNGAATPIPGATVTVEGVVIGDFQPIPNDNRLSGFFVQEEDADFDADPLTSEGIFVFCSACPTNVAEGQKVQVTGTVSEFFNNTQITATTAGSVVITNAGNNLASVTPAMIDLPVVTPSIDDYYEPRENMLVNYVDTLTVSEYFEQARYGRIELFEGGRPFGYTEDNAPSVAGYAAHLDNLSRRRVYIDDDDNVENSVLNLPNGQQFVFHPQANGGLSVGTQGTDFFRGGDQVSNLTGILHYSFSGGSSPNEWRIRPAAATPAAFTVVNPRPAAPPVVGGAIRAASVNVLNYFTTLNQRGADSAAELNRQRDRTALVLCDLDADVAALMEIENHPTNATITDLLGAVNAQCGGTHPYTFVNTGGALGTDEIRVLLIYRTGVLSPVGAPQVDMDAVHNRPPTAQTFDVVDALNPAFGQRFTVLANHSKSKGSCPGPGPDADQLDGQGCWAPTRVAQHNRLLTWVNGTVIPAAGDPDVLMLGDFNSNGSETPTTTLTSNGYTDLEVFFDPNSYSYVFDGQIGHLDYAFASASLLPQITGSAPWHINADENPLFDYNDEIDDGAAEQFFEEKPDGSALVPPRVLFQPASRYRASDHDPVLAGIFAISDLVIAKTDSPDPVASATNLTYAITVTNNGPDPAANASWTDNLTDTTFVSISAPAGWTCPTTPAVGATGTINCTNPNFGVGNAVFTLTTAVPQGTANGTVLSNSVSVTSSSAEGNPGDENDTETTTVANSADLSVTKSDSPDPVDAGNNITYTITLNNAGPSFAETVELTDTIPAGTTFVSLASPGGWSCTTPAVGGTGNISCTNAAAGLGDHVFTLIVNVAASTAAGTSISNSATVTTTTSDPNGGNETGNSVTDVAASADLSVTKSDSPDPVNAGANITYTITVNNAGPSNASTVELTDTIPANTTFVSLANPGGWSCTTPSVGGTGNISCTNASAGLGDHVFTLVVNVDPSTAAGTSISNSATVTSTTSDPNGGNETGNSATDVAASADLSVTKSDSPDPVTAGANITYTITVNNAGPSNASTVELTDTIPANTTFVSLASPGGWSCTTPSVGGTGNISCTNASAGLGNHVFTLVVNVDPSTAAGTSISNSATVTSGTSDPNGGNETGNSATDVATSADLSVTKSDSPDPVNAGANITYTITVNNAGPSNASTVTLTDILPAETLFFSLSSPAGWVCSTPGIFSTGTVTCTAASAGVGNHVFTLVLYVQSATPSGTVINNSATVSTSATPDPNIGNETGSSTTNVTTSANMSVTKTDSPDPVNAGSNITYSITVTNGGPSNADDVTLSDTLPAGTTFVSFTNPLGWTCSTPAVGATGAVSCSKNNAQVAGTATPFTLVVKVDPDVAAGTVISNSLTATTTTPDPNSTNNTGTATTNVATSADLSVTKTDSPDPVTAGTNLTYTITVNNAGPSNASTVTLNDTIPANTTFVSLSSPGGWSCTTPAVGGTGNVSCSNASLAPGNAVFTLVVNVGAAVADGTIITNTATAASPTDSNNANDSGTATTTVGTGSADLSVTKTDSPDPVTPGANVTYTITVNNAGPSNATSVTLTDAVPSSTIFVSFTAPAGWSCTTPAVGNTGTISCSIPTMITGNAVFTLIVQSGYAYPGGALPISNTVTVASATTDPNPGNESATATTAIGSQVADISVTKADSPDPVTPGTNLTYTISLTNAGPSGSDNMGFTDTLPPGTSLVSLSGGGGGINCIGFTGATSFSCAGSVLPPVPPGTFVFTAVVAVDPSVAPGTVLTNTVVTFTDTFDPNTSNDDTTTTTTVGPASANLSVTKTDSPDPVAPGSNLTYTITVNNVGPSNASNLSLSDSVPANTTFVSLSAPAGWSCTTPAVGGTGPINCTNAGLAVGDAVFTLTVNVDSGVAAGTILSNTASVTSATADPQPGDESDTETTTVGSGSADLSVTKTDTPDPVTPGNNLTYTITVNNAGPSSATSATMTDNLPFTVTFVSLSTPAGWSCTTPAVGASGLISCSNPSMAIGSAVFTLVVQTSPFIEPPTTISNTATTGSATTDPNQGNESATATTSLSSPVDDYAVTKTDSPDPVMPGSNITYTMTITNNGPSGSLTAYFQDTMPAGTTFVSINAPNWSCPTNPTGSFTCTRVTVPPGDVSTVTLVLAVDPTVLPGTVLTNTINAGGNFSEPTPADNTATTTTTVGAGSADLSVTKTDTPDLVVAGSNLTYTITLNNAGPSSAVNATLNDTVPANTTFVSFTAPAGWSCTTPAAGGTGAISCSHANVDLGDDVFTLVVNVDASTAASTIITNTATTASATADPNTGNNSGSATSTVAASDADVSVTKVGTPNPVAPGTNITYTITVTNAGPNAAVGAVLSDTVPGTTTFLSLAAPAGWTCITPAVGGIGPLSCSNPSMGIGSAVFTLVVTVNAGANDGTTINNTATFTSTSTDPNPGNESATATTTVDTGNADLSLTKVDDADPVIAGANLTYTLTVNNAGPDAANSVTLNDTLPPETTFVSIATPAGWTCTTPAVGATGAITCSNASMAVGSAVFTLVVNVSSTTPGGSVITNNASVTSGTFDPNTGNEIDSETTNVLSPATVTGTKSASGTFTPGSTVTYTIVLSNAGPAAQSDNPGPEFTDVLPSQLTLVSANATTGTAVATVGTNTVTWNGSIPAGGSVTITIQAIVEADVPVGTTVSNQGTISFDADGNGTNEGSAFTGGAPTSFVVAAPTGIGEVPALDGFGLAILAAMLAALGLVVMRRT